MNVRRIAALLRELADEFDSLDGGTEAAAADRRTTPRGRRTARSPAPIEKVIEVSPLNRARARDALRKRGYHVPRSTDEDR
jgi:hypothetical protein